jgi:DNA-binding NarL/FixJ family response regulator
MARWQFVRQLEIDGVSYGLFRRDPALSRREAEALALLGRGLTNKEIAFEMRISPSTVSVLLFRAAARLGTSSRAELRAAAVALRQGEAAA